MSIGFFTAAVALGGGHHGVMLPPLRFRLTYLFILVGLMMGALSFTLTKVAVVLLVIKLLFPTQWHIRFLWTLVAGNVVFMTAAGLVYFLQCNPPQALWVLDIEHKCLDSVFANSFAISASSKFGFLNPVSQCIDKIVLCYLALSALADFYLAAYPAVVLWSLDMNRRKKLALSVALGFGAWWVPQFL